jgi:hypothetical protein
VIPMRYVSVLLVLLALLCFGASSLREAKGRSEARMAEGRPTQARPSKLQAERIRLRLWKAAGEPPWRFMARPPR